MRTMVAVALSALLVLVVAGCSSLATLGSMLGSQVTFTQPQLQRALEHNFPKQYDELGGLASLRLSNPSLSIPYEGTRLRLEFEVGLSAIGSSSATTGHFALSSGLRFDPGTRGLHLQDPVIESVDVEALGAMDTSAREVLSAWLADHARREPVYRLDESLIQRLATRRIQSTVIDHGVVVMNLGS